MLRKLFILVCLIGATNAIAQTKPNPQAKTTEKQGAEIDYKQTGMPMPPLKVLLYHDTAKATVPKADSVAEQGSRKSRKKKKQEEEEKTAAAEEMYLTDKDVDNGANLFVMIFNPTCSHCQDETEVLEKNISLFKKTQVVMVANPIMKTYMHDFYKQLHVDQYPTLHVGIDSSAFIGKVFVYGMLPQITIYDGDRKLLKIYNGETAVDSLKKYIE